MFSFCARSLSSGLSEDFNHLFQTILKIFLLPLVALIRSKIEYKEFDPLSHPQPGGANPSCHMAEYSPVHFHTFENENVCCKLMKTVFGSFTVETTGT